MPLPVIANTYRVSLNWTNTTTTQRARSVMHFLAVASNSANVYAALNANVTNQLWQTAGVDSQVQTVDVLPLDGTSATVTFATGSTAKWKGPNSAGNFVVAPAFLVKAQTGIRGPAHRGRTFLPFSIESAISNGQVDTAFVTAAQTGWDAFLAAMTAAAILPVVASYRHSSQDLIVKYLCEQPMGTLRRRQNRLRVA